MADFSAPMTIGGGGGGGPRAMGGHGPDLGTLDEPVSQTIMRDLTMVGNKMMCVLNPRKANIQTLKNWDLWGPLILCLMLATLLSWFAPYEQKSLVFASVFVIVWLGAAVVTVNALLLGGNISFFQSVCVLGYCIFPLNIASFICLLGGPLIWRMIVVAVCFFWSTGASLGARARTLPVPCAATALWSVVVGAAVVTRARGRAHANACKAAAAPSRCFAPRRLCRRLHGRAGAAESQGAGGVSSLPILHSDRVADHQCRQAVRRRLCRCPLLAGGSSEEQRCARAE